MLRESVIAMIEVSVIIPAFNEEKYVGACLTSILAQTHPAYEVIVVDDGSTDQTAEIVQSFDNVTLLRQRHAGPALARNLGAEHAQGRILVFVDADQTFSPTFLEKLVQPIVEGRAIGTNSKEEYVANLDNVWARCWNINENVTLGRIIPEDYPDEMPIFRAILRSEFLKVGGYDDTGSGDDRTVSDKLGLMAQAAPGAVFYHSHPTSLKEVFYQARWKAKGQHGPKTFMKTMQHTLPWSLKGSVKRALRYRNPYFPLFLIVYDFGILIGSIEHLLRPRFHWK
ncbi:MAG: glycosyltransferase family 2 protein [Chloroflexi bacterium]|nr:glycosyltransferase family 2 protein [Chloroflexota bacterium]